MVASQESLEFGKDLLAREPWSNDGHVEGEPVSVHVMMLLPDQQRLVGIENADLVQQARQTTILCVGQDGAIKKAVAFPDEIYKNLKEVPGEPWNTTKRNAGRELLANNGVLFRAEPLQS